jgi:hypothetical protein
LFEYASIAAAGRAVQERLVRLFTSFPFNVRIHEKAAGRLVQAVIQ